MATQAYIDDGYTEDGYMKEVPGIHQALKFQYRPPLANEVREILHHWGDISSVERSQRINDAIVKHISKWDYEYKKKILPIEVAVLEKSKQPFVDRIFNIITGSDVSDKDLSQKQVSIEEDAKN
ncbi:hypothetical protein [Gimesia sp.]|uniref:hypothetical protein n=1 Tax=Gimesia sp. TaxID=2024833 RepID=UPI003A9018A2